jgi:PKHD-type hydroxylase
MDWWRLHRKVFTEEQCKAICERAFTYPARKGTVGYGGEKKVGVVSKIRKSTLRWLNREDLQLQWAYLRMERLALESNEMAFGLEISGLCGGFHAVQFTEYHGDEEHHYDWHADDNWKRREPFDRKLSKVIQLSKPEDYEGGRLELWNDPLPEGHFREQGDVIVFPAFNRHRVTPVTKGLRYSLVTWFLGPKLR